MALSSVKTNPNSRLVKATVNDGKSKKTVKTNTPPSSKPAQNSANLYRTLTDSCSKGTVDSARQTPRNAELRPADQALAVNGETLPPEKRRIHGKALPKQGPSLGHRVAWHLYHGLVRMFFNVSIKGEIPKGGAFLASNHPTILEGPLGVLLSPRVRPVARPQADKFQAAMLKAGSSILTNHKNYKVAVDHVRHGNIVWIAPEGEMQPYLLHEVKSGVARLSYLANAPIVPMIVKGSTDALSKWRPWRRPKIEIELGEPFYPFANIRQTNSELLVEMRQKQAAVGVTREAGPETVKNYVSSTGKPDRYKVTVMDLRAGREIP